MDVHSLSKWRRSCEICIITSTAHLTTMSTPLSPKGIHSPLPSGVVSPTGLRPALKHTTSRPTSPIPSPTPPVLSPKSPSLVLPARSRQNSLGNGASGISSRPLAVPTPSGSRYTTKVSFDTFDAPNTDADTLFSFTLQVCYFLSDISV